MIEILRQFWLVDPSFWIFSIIIDLHTMDILCKIYTRAACLGIHWTTCTALHSVFHSAVFGLMNNKKKKSNIVTNRMHPIEIQFFFVIKLMGFERLDASLANGLLHFLKRYTEKKRTKWTSKAVGWYLFSFLFFWVRVGFCVLPFFRLPFQRLKVWKRLFLTRSGTRAQNARDRYRFLVLLVF